MAYCFTLQFISGNLRVQEVKFGEVSEWLKEQPWKGCVRYMRTGGSSPPLSVIIILFNEADIGLDPKKPLRRKVRPIKIDQD